MLRPVVNLFSLSWLLLCCVDSLNSSSSPARSNSYSDEWAVHIPGDQNLANEVARDLGFENLGQIGALDNYYLLKKSVAGRSKRSYVRHTELLRADKRIAWVEQQRHIDRYKRDFLTKRQEDIAYRRVAYDDDYWSNQWYLFDTRSTASSGPKLDLHVIPVWSKNITGAGVVVTILDDGIEHNHTDLWRNYDPDASYDLNDDDHDPYPRYDPTNENKHGTRCAGEVAMLANNHKCGVGVAYNARIGGIRMLDGYITDSLEARALSFNIPHIHIYSASWGPSDNGQTWRDQDVSLQLLLKREYERDGEARE